MEKKKCSLCDGDGIIPGELEYDHDDMPIQDWDDCPKCNGQGFIFLLSQSEREYGEAMMPDKGK